MEMKKYNGKRNPIRIIDYPCPCCGKTILNDENYICDYCGWNDCLYDGNDDDGVNIISLAEAIELFKQGKNVDGGTLPWLDWYNKSIKKLTK